MKTVALLLSIVVLAGCEQAPVKATEPKGTFEVVAGTNGHLALRKDTGQLCRTWYWVCANTTSPEADSTYGITCSGINQIPLCERLK